MLMKFDRSFVTVNGVQVNVTRKEAQRLAKEAGFTLNPQGAVLEVVPPTPAPVYQPNTISL